ncbi:MAG: hypothetical protein U9O96_03010 [Candidatus Thermoplasmatota archaeon]|nr:hypothetical protein [Candidatus Thermoplasmatota archaeon]
MKNIHPNRSICENKFGYRSKLEVYKNSSSDIPELGEMPPTKSKSEIFMKTDAFTIDMMEESE